MEYRIDQLAAATGVSVDTLRYYQSRRLLPAPLHHGRRAWYAAEHLQRVERIRELQRQGLTLAGIRRVLDGAATPATATSPPPWLRRARPSTRPRSRLTRWRCD